MENIHFLLTNDDGITSQGLYHLWKGVKDLGKVTIIAPDSQRSGASQAFTLESSLKVSSVDWEENTLAYQVSGTPVDCVKIGLKILKDKPTFILSGVNSGHNLGRTLLYSGTVGAIIEGVFSHIPGAAFSYFKENQEHHAHIEKYITSIMEYLLKITIPEGTFYNINFPEHLDHDIKGFKVTRQGRSQWEALYESFLVEKDLMYKHAGRWITHLEDIDTDCHYNKNGFITASPIKVTELTDYDLLNSQKDSFEKFIAGKFRFTN